MKPILEIEQRSEVQNQLASFTTDCLSLLHEADQIDILEGMIDDLKNLREGIIGQYEYHTTQKSEGGY